MNAIEGWFSHEAGTLMQWIASNVPGEGALEFGVYKGKSLALAAALFRGPIVGVDAMWNGMNNPLVGPDLEHAKSTVLANIATMAPRAEVQLIVSDTTLLNATDLTRYSPEGFTFISVDAGHDAEPVAHDMDLAATLLSPGGVVFLDDAFNAACPGVGEGMFRFLATDGRLKAFATGYNKTLFTDAASHGTWLERAYQWAESSEGPMFDRTREQLRANEGALWKPMLAGDEIVPFR